MRTKANFRKDHWIWYIILFLTLLVELILVVLPILLNVAPDSAWAYWVFVGFSPVRIIGFVGLSLLVNLKWGWREYFRMDGLLATVIGSSLSYVLLVIRRPGSDLVLNIIISSFYAPVLFTFVGHFRVMLAFYPWGRWTALIYKTLRFAHVVVFLLSEALPEIIETIENKDEEEEPAKHKESTAVKAAFIASTLHLVLHLLEHFGHVEHEIGHHSPEHDGHSGDSHTKEHELQTTHHETSTTAHHAHPHE